jgi:hypothetical protein
VPGLFKIITDILSYKEPKNKELGFELLEEGAQNKYPEQPLTVEQENADSNVVSTELCVNLEVIKQKFLISKNQDVIIREFRIGRKIKAFMAYIDGMMDKQTLNLPYCRS